MTGWVSPALDQTEFAEMTAIEPGIPNYMRAQLTKWITDRCGGDSYLDLSIPRALTLVFKDEFPEYGLNFRDHLEGLDDDQLVSVIDWMLYHDIKNLKSDYSHLKSILDLGRSEWTVAEVEERKPRMSRRIPAGVDESYRDVVAKTEAAGSLLAEAFNAIYGAQPNANESYGLSVKAVETIACPRYLPTSTRATLGSVIAHLANKDVQLPLLDGNVPDKDLIVSMMRKLWAGGERHGSETYQHVSIPGAKTALALAFSLVSMLHEETITVS